MANPRGFSQTGIELLYAELARRGISPEAATGAIAGIMGESGANLDPTSFNSKDPGGGSGGIGQWNRGRLVGPNGMLAFARNAGVPIDTSNPLDAKKVPFAVQAQYLGHELDTTYSGVRDQLRAANNPQQALNVWVNSYENPLDKAGAIAQRNQYLAPVGTTLNSMPATSVPGAAPAPAPVAPGPIDPSIIARGGVSPPIPDPSAVANNKGILPGFGTADASNTFLKGANQLAKGAAGQDDGSQQAPRAPPMPQPQPPHMPQTFGQTLNSPAPLQWGPGTPGSAGAGTPIAPASPVGTSLSSLQQMMLQMGYGGMGYG